MDKKKILEKWQPFLDIQGQENLYFDQPIPKKDNSTLLPISMKIAAKTIGLDLISVKPIGGGNSSDEMDRIKREIKTENRDNKIDSILNNSEYVEKSNEDHPLFNKPSYKPMGLIY